MYLLQPRCCSKLAVAYDLSKLSKNFHFAHKLAYFDYHTQIKRITLMSYGSSYAGFQVRNVYCKFQRNSHLRPLHKISFVMLAFIPFRASFFKTYHA